MKEGFSANDYKEDSDVSITDKQIKGLLFDIVTAGTDTTSTTVEWAMAEVINNPEVMANAQKELSDVVGVENAVQESHISRLKYLNAIIKEAMRLHPLLIPRYPSQSSVIGRYLIPKNTTIFINVWSIQRDPSIWKNPHEFKP